MREPHEGILDAAERIAFSRISPRNRHYIRIRYRQGLTVNEIWRRCHERLIWDGPLPSVKDIEIVIKDETR